MADLNRFIQAQSQYYTQALQELRAGQKRSHWMWFIFPQLKGLGHSSYASHYGVDSLQEARSYLQHPILGQRYLELCQVLATLPQQDIRAILGSPDDMKLRSSLTLFKIASDRKIALFQTLLDRYYQGADDPQTLKLLAKA